MRYISFGSLLAILTWNMNYQINFSCKIVLAYVNWDKKLFGIFGSIFLSIQCHITPWLILVSTTLCNYFGLGNPTLTYYFVIPHHDDFVKQNCGIWERSSFNCNKNSRTFTLDCNSIADKNSNLSSIRTLLLNCWIRARINISRKLQHKLVRLVIFRIKVRTSIAWSYLFEKHWKQFSYFGNIFGE